jgi:hypothetical protein
MYLLDVAIGSWKGSLDLLTMDTVGWGPRGDNGLEKGPCASFPTCHFFHSQSEGMCKPIKSDQSQISARFDGSPAADPCIRPQWRPDSLEDSGSLWHPVNP